MGCFNETTCVKINREKKDLAKSKGFKLQNLLDQSLDEALGFDFAPMGESRIKEIDKELDSLKQEKENSMRVFQSRIDMILKELTDFRDAEAKLYDKKIRELELEKEYNKQLLGID